MPKHGWAGRRMSNTFKTEASRMKVWRSVVRKLRSLILPSSESVRPVAHVRHQRQVLHHVLHDGLRGRDELEGAAH